MTLERPGSRWDGPMSKLVVALFLLVIGGLINQFLNIPAQQMHQDDRLAAIEKHLEYNDSRLDKIDGQMDVYGTQHQLILQKLDSLQVMHEAKRGKH